MNNSDDIDEQHFMNGVTSTFFSWVFKALLPTVFLVLFVAFLMVGVVTNALLLYVSNRENLHKHSIHTFILQLSVLDLIACFLIVLPSLIAAGIGASSASSSVFWSGEFCTVHLFLFLTCFLITFSIYHVALLERTIQVASETQFYLKSFGNPCCTRLSVFFIWVGSITLSAILTIVGRDSIQYRKHQYNCAINFDEAPEIMYMLFALTMFSSPLIFLLFMVVIFCSRRRGLIKEQKRISETQSPTILGDRGEVSEGSTDEVDFTDATNRRHRSKRKLTRPRTIPFRYNFSHHTERNQSGSTSVFHIERLKPDQLLWPIMKPLHQSNVRVGIASSSNDKSENYYDVPANDGLPSDHDVKYGIDQNKSKNESPNFQENPQRFSNALKKKVYLPEFQSKQLWIKAKGRVKCREISLSVFRDVPHDMHHHQTITYVISWAVTYSFFILYSISAMIEVLNSEPCYACYRVGVLLALCSYIVRPLVYLAHNRWYRQQCRLALGKFTCRGDTEASSQ